MFQVGQASAEPKSGNGFIANMAMGPEAVDRELRRIANAERRLEHDKAHLLTQAVRLRIWSHFGRGSLSEYLEEVFGYTPKVAREHVRVAFAARRAASARRDVGVGRAELYRLTRALPGDHRRDRGRVARGRARHERSAGRGSSRGTRKAIDRASQRIQISRSRRSRSSYVPERPRSCGKRGKRSPPRSAALSMTAK